MIRPTSSPRQAIVYNDEDGNPSPGPNPVTVGLAGLHITQKTPRPAALAVVNCSSRQTLNKAFNNPNCPALAVPAQCADGAHAVRRAQLPRQSAQISRCQVVGVSPTTAGTYNTTFQGLLKGTPWAYYQLISTQWQGGSGAANETARNWAILYSKRLCRRQTPTVVWIVTTWRRTSPGGAKSDFSFAINAKQ